jgi:hypothetical protein
MSDQPIAEIFTYTVQHNRQTSTPRARFEPATPATKRPQTYALDCAATGIGIHTLMTSNFFPFFTNVNSYYRFDHVYEEALSSMF